MIIGDAIIMARFEADGDSSNMPCAATTDPLFISLNEARRKVYSWIRQADGRWQFGTTLETDFPVATTTLVSGQEDYQLDPEIDEIESIEVMDKNGAYYLLTPIDRDDIKKQGIAFSEYQKTAGRPLEYDKQGSSLVLKPAPDNGVSVTLAAGLKVNYKRPPATLALGVVTTGTAALGFSTTVDPVIPLLMAEPFVRKNHPERLNGLLERIGDFEPSQGGPRGFKKTILDLYSHRDKDEIQQITCEPIRHR